VKLSQLGEFGLIERIAKHEPKLTSTIMGIGDDCAVLQIKNEKLKIKNEGRYLLITTDTLAENVHFKRQTTLFKVLGEKAMLANISDVAAMGGWPTHALVTIGVPKNLDVSAIDQLYQGINKIARQAKIDIVGGDTVSSPNELFISITLLGEVEKENLLTRSGASVGDLIMATGEFGGAARDNFEHRKQKVESRAQEGRKIAKSQLATAMIDSSDGLARSIMEIAKASKCGAVIYGTEVPKAKGATLEQALHGGEEYELVFTVPPKNVPQLVKILKATKLSIVGEIRAKKEGVGLLTKDGERIQLERGGYEHFRD
jgi:thiamine-monophosphate kinase